MSNDNLVLDLAAAARATLGGNRGAAEEAAFNALASADAQTPRRVQQVLVDLLADCLGHTWKGGWQPLDLHELTRRELTREHTGVLSFVTAQAMLAWAAPLVHPDWLDQLTEVGAPPSWPAGSNALEAWQRAERRDAVWSVTLGIELLALLMGVPRIEMLLPLPGAYRPGTSSSGEASSGEGAVNQKMLARVRALLAKAESTEFDEEAEALSAKAQELMTRYSLDRLLVEASGPAQKVASGRRIWLETPYVQAKALLVVAVGEANRSSVVWTEHLGFVTVIGDERDLVATDLMVTSLLVQAGRAMLHGGRQAGGQKRSYRQSFLVAYAQRIGERLREASEHVAAEVGTAALVPLLAAHDERVAAAREQMFPSTKARNVSVSNAHGYAAGRAAADLAVLAGPRTLPGGAA